MPYSAADLKTLSESVQDLSDPRWEQNTIALKAAMETFERAMSRPNGVPKLDLGEPIKCDWFSEASAIALAPFGGSRGV